MEQLPLDVQLADYAVFESFFAADNDAPVAALKALASSGQRSVIWLWGAAETGKSHLLQACVAAASQLGKRAAYLPLADPDLHAPVLEGFGAMDLVCLDDVHRVAGQVPWEEQLFALFELPGNNSASLVFAAGSPVSAAGFRLPDLASRLASGPTYQLAAMNDEQRLDALQRRANWRGLQLPEETGRFLLNRVERNTGALFGLLDQLDQAALAAQRKLTVPFVKSVLSSP